MVEISTRHEHDGYPRLVMKIYRRPPNGPANYPLTHRNAVVAAKWTKNIPAMKLIVRDSINHQTRPEVNDLSSDPVLWEENNVVNHFLEKLQIRRCLE